jgi:hypothetical protein
MPAHRRFMTLEKHRGVKQASKYELFHLVIFRIWIQAVDVGGLLWRARRAYRCLDRSLVATTARMRTFPRPTRICVCACLMQIHSRSRLLVLPTADLASVACSAMLSLHPSTHQIGVLLANPRPNQHTHCGASLTEALTAPT